MLPKTDYQKTKVYRWEDHVMGPLEKGHITIAQAQDWVDFIWYNEGRTHPPKIRTDHNKKGGADATRLNIRVTDFALKRWIITHEVAHSLLDDGEVRYGHGPMFVQKYIDLLDKYMKIPKLMLQYTLQEASVDYKP